MRVRAARPSDSDAACAVLRASITELCAADHRGSAAILERWLANKTPETVRAWIAQPGAHVFVAVEGEAVLGVGALSGAGEITLNYVAPEARFRGVSKALLKRLEAKAAKLGHTEARLTSTATALRFYRDAGYKEAGPAETPFGDATAQPMVKSLTG